MLNSNNNYFNYLLSQEECNHIRANNNNNNSELLSTFCTKETSNNNNNNNGSTNHNNLNKCKPKQEFIFNRNLSTKKYLNSNGKASTEWENKTNNNEKEVKANNYYSNNNCYSADESSQLLRINTMNTHQFNTTMKHFRILSSRVQKEVRKKIYFLTLSHLNLTLEWNIVNKVTIEQIYLKNFKRLKKKIL